MGSLLFIDSITVAVRFVFLVFGKLPGGEVNGEGAGFKGSAEFYTVVML